MGEEFPQEFGQYTLHELIGRGGMAEIYRATMPGIGGFEKTVAIKKILPHLAEDDEFTSMLIDEARIIESLDHSNIAQVFDLGKREGTYYIAMEYIHGLDLSEIIDELDEQGKYIPIPHVIHITSSICAGLHFAHTQTDEDGNPLNVIHRDISPHNIRLSFAGEVKIIDFGVAKAADREAHTKMGVIKGKLLYMAPEQAKAEDLDGRADLFATGLCAYKMLTGELPFEGENEFQVYNNILQKEIVPPKEFRPEIPDELNRIIMKLLERDRDQRYQEGYAAKQDLDKLLHEVAPGYTVNRLSRWVEANFSHLAQQESEAADKTVTSNPSDIAPATPTGQRNPGTDQREADELEAEKTDAEQVPEPVQADGGQATAGSATQPARPDHLDEDGGAAGKHRTETSADEATGQFVTPEDGSDESGVPGVVYAIVALVIAIAGMVGYALTVDSGGGAGAENNKKQTAEKAAGGGADSDEAEAISGLVQIEISSNPNEAKLVRKGEVVGRTPAKFVLPKGREAIKLTLVKSGYRDKTIGLVPMGDIQKTIELAATGDVGTDAGPDAGSPGDQKPARNDRKPAPKDAPAPEDEKAEEKTAGGDEQNTASTGGRAPAESAESEGSGSSDDWGGVGATPEDDEGGGSAESSGAGDSEQTGGSGQTGGSQEESGAAESAGRSGPSGTSADADDSGETESLKLTGGSGSDDNAKQNDETSSKNTDDEIIDPFAK